MSLQEAERRRHSDRTAEGARRRKRARQQARQQARRRQQAHQQALHRGNEHAVLTFLEWCALNGISPATGRRILAGENGPVVTQLSERRIGVTIANDAAWKEARARKPQQTVTI